MKKIIAVGMLALTLIISVVSLQTFLRDRRSGNLTGKNDSSDTLSSSSGTSSKSATSSRPSLVDLEEIASSETVYASAPEKGYKQLETAKYSFTLDIPDNWQAFERTKRDDGFAIESGAAMVEISTYGNKYDAEMTQRLEKHYVDIVGVKITEFTFANGVKGKKYLKESEFVSYTYHTEDKEVSLYISFPQNVSWYNENKELIEEVAKTLQDVE